MIEIEIKNLTEKLAALTAVIAALSAKLDGPTPPAVSAAAKAESGPIDVITGKPGGEELERARQRSADAVAAVEAEERKRTRRTKAEMEAAKAEMEAAEKPAPKADLFEDDSGDEDDFGAPPEKPATLDEVMALARNLATSAKVSSDEIKAKITRLGAPKMSALPADKLQILYRELKAA